MRGYVSLWGAWLEFAGSAHRELRGASYTEAGVLFLVWLTAGGALVLLAPVWLVAWCAGWTLKRFL